MVVRLRITLEQTEFSALLKLALSELRTPESQLIFILREELSRHNQTVMTSNPEKGQDKSICKGLSNGK